jgi:hypothetical protein
MWHTLLDAIEFFFLFAVDEVVHANDVHDVLEVHSLIERRPQLLLSF